MNATKIQKLLDQGRAIGDGLREYQDILEVLDLPEGTVALAEVKSLIEQRATLKETCVSLGCSWGSAPLVAKRLKSDLTASKDAYTTKLTRERTRRINLRAKMHEALHPGQADDGNQNIDELLEELIAEHAAATQKLETIRDGINKMIKEAAK